MSSASSIPEKGIQGEPLPWFQAPFRNRNNPSLFGTLDHCNTVFGRIVIGHRNNVKLFEKGHVDNMLGVISLSEHGDNAE